MDWTLPLKAHRVPTRRDVEELAEKCGGAFWWVKIHYGPRTRSYFYQPPGGDPILLQEVTPGNRPDWRAMLKQMGSDWA